MATEDNIWVDGLNRLIHSDGSDAEPVWVDGLSLLVHDFDGGEDETGFVRMESGNMPVFYRV
jgi:hypothetical protein